MTYEGLKNFYKNHRQQIIYGVCFVLIFLVGYGAGRAEKETQTASTRQLHNITGTSENTANSPAGEFAPPPANLPPVPPPTVTQTTATNCVVKGNISGQNKIYHVKGGSFYDRTQPEQCFATEAEAVAAGYRKSSR